jgi:hypothetical protein
MITQSFPYDRCWYLQLNRNERYQPAKMKDENDGKNNAGTHLQEWSRSGSEIMGIPFLSII